MISSIFNSFSISHFHFVPYLQQVFLFPSLHHILPCLSILLVPYMGVLLIIDLDLDIEICFTHDAHYSWQPHPSSPQPTTGQTHVRRPWCPAFCSPHYIATLFCLISSRSSSLASFLRLFFCCERNTRNNRKPHLGGKPPTTQPPSFGKGCMLLVQHRPPLFAVAYSPASFPPGQCQLKSGQANTTNLAPRHRRAMREVDHSHLMCNTSTLSLHPWCWDIQDLFFYSDHRN